MGAGAAPLTMATSWQHQWQQQTAAVGAASASAAIAGAATATTAVATSPIWAPVVTGAAVFAAVAAVALHFLQFACETQDSMDAQSPSADPVSKGFRRGYSMPLAISAKGVGATTALFSEAPCGVAHMLPSRIQILQALRQRSRCWGASGIRILLHSLDLPFRVPWSTSWPVQIWEPDCTWTQSSTGRPACRLPTTSAKALHSCKGVAPRFSTATSSSTMFCSISEVLLRLLRLQTSAWLCCLKPPPSTLRWSGGHQCPRFRATRVMLWHHLLWAVDPWRDCPRATANLCGRKSTSRTSMAGALGRLAH